MWVEDEADNRSIRSFHGRRDDAVTDVRRGTVFRSSRRKGSHYRAGNVIDSPVRKGARGWIRVGKKSEFVATGAESNVERLVEVGLHAKELRPPRPCRR